MSTHGRTTIEIRPSEPLAVEFTSSWHYSGPVLVDELEDAGRLARWIATYRERLALPAGHTIEVGPDDLPRVTNTRAAVRGLLDACVDGRQPSGPDLDLVNRESRLPRPDGLDWGPAGPVPLWPSAATQASTADLVAAQCCASAVRFLSSPRRQLLRRCPAPRCVLFFSALRPGQTWCSPACGNRARVARHSART